MAKKKVKKHRPAPKVRKAKKPVRHAAAAKTPPKSILHKRTKPIKKPVSIQLIVRSAAAQPPAKQRATPATPLSSDQVDKFRDVLSQKRDDLMAIVQRKKEEEIEDVGVGDEADVATHSVEKEMLFELTDSEKQTLDMIEAALLKLDRGSYGACESCQNGIPRMRLQVMPWARYCVNCQTEQEVPSNE